MASVKVRGLPFGWFTVLPVSSTFGDEVGKSMALEIQKGGSLPSLDEHQFLNLV